MSRLETRVSLSELNKIDIRSRRDVGFKGNVCIGKEKIGIEGKELQRTEADTQLSIHQNEKGAMRESEQYRTSIHVHVHRSSSHQIVSNPVHERPHNLTALAFAPALAFFRSLRSNFGFGGFWRRGTIYWIFSGIWIKYLGAGWRRGTAYRTLDGMMTSTWAILFGVLGGSEGAGVAG